MSYFKKTIKIIIIVVYLQFTSCHKILDSIYNFGLKLDNMVFCNEYWFPKDFTGLKQRLNTDLIGQPFVNNNLIPIVEDHFLKPHPKERPPLLLSFHGPTGIGKSFVADILSSSPFIKNIHYFSSKVDFADPGFVNEYKVKLNRVIDSSIRDCERSLFVFDDADYLASGIIDKLNAFSNKKNDLKYGESIFIFIFQVGSEQIIAATYDLLNKGIKRDVFGIPGFRDIIRSALLDKGMEDNIFLSPVNKVIPFLPLEKVHIKKFIKTQCKKDGYEPNEKDIEKVYEQLEFKEGSPFSTSGCKLAKSKMHIIFNRKTEF